jgi:hypothetical protein
VTNWAEALKEKHKVTRKGKSRFAMCFTKHRLFCCAGVADFAGVCWILQSWNADVLCFQSP